jgi:hypothetical protein
VGWRRPSDRRGHTAVGRCCRQARLRVEIPIDANIIRMAGLQDRLRTSPAVKLEDRFWGWNGEHSCKRLLNSSSRSGGGGGGRPTDIVDTGRACLSLSGERLLAMLWRRSSHQGRGHRDGRNEMQSPDHAGRRRRAGGGGRGGGRTRFGRRVLPLARQ